MFIVEDKLEEFSKKLSEMEAKLANTGNSREERSP